MADIAKLKTELLAGHPDTGAYNADDALAAGELNAVNRTTNKTSMTGSEVMQAVVKADFVALSAGDQQQVWNILHLGTLDPFGIEADLLADIFVGSDTVAALAAARVNNVSRAVELGIGLVGANHVELARR